MMHEDEEEDEEEEEEEEHRCHTRDGDVFLSHIRYNTKNR